MNGKHMKVLALALVVMLALSGCNLIRTDPAYLAQLEAEEAARVQAAYEADMNQVVASFAGGTLTKGEIVDDYQDQLEGFTGYIGYSNYLMSMFGGQTYQITKADVENLRQKVAEDAVTRKVLENKLADLGLAPMTEEERAGLDAKVAAEYQAYIEDYTTGGADEATAKAYLSYEGITERILAGTALDAYYKSRLTGIVNADTAVTEEEITAKYEALVEADKALAESGVEDLEEKVQTSQTAYYMPENAKFVKHVFLMPDDDVRTARVTARTAVTKATNELNTLEKKLANGEDVAEDIEAKKAEKAEAEANLKAAEDAVWENVSERLAKVNAAVEEGRDFDAIVAEFNDDNQHGLESVLVNGYLVCESSSQWDEAFLEAVKALENVGDISEPILGSTGVHVILYASEVPAGATALDDVKAEVEALALTDKQDAAYDAAVKAWVEEADVKYDFSGWTL